MSQSPWVLSVQAHCGMWCQGGRAEAKCPPTPRGSQESLQCERDWCQEGSEAAGLEATSPCFPCAPFHQMSPGKGPLWQPRPLHRGRCGVALVGGWWCPGWRRRWCRQEHEGC